MHSITGQLHVCIIGSCRAAWRSKEVMDRDGVWQMNTFPRCWTSHTKAVELVKSLKEQIKRRECEHSVEQCSVTAAQDKSARAFSLYMTRGLQAPVARQHPWSPRIVAQYARYPNRAIHFRTFLPLYYITDIKLRNRLKVQVIQLFKPPAHQKIK